MTTQFGEFIHHSDTKQRFERAPRPRATAWQLEEINALTRSLLISSAFRVPGNRGEKGRHTFDAFADVLSAALPKASIDEARSRLDWGRGPGLQRFVLAQADLHYPALQVVDSVEAIADITRTPQITDAKFHSFKNEFMLSNLDASLSPLRSLSLLAISSLKETD